MYGESAPAITTVYNWVNEFKRGHTSTKEEHCLGCLVEVSTSKIINKIHSMVLSDQRIKLRKIVEAKEVSQGTIVSNLHDKLDMRKLSTRGASCLLSAGNERNRVVTSEALLGCMCRNLDEFLHQFITVDET